MKKIFICILAVAAILACFGCSSERDKRTYKIVIDGDFKNGAKIAYKEEVDLPLASVKDDKGNVVSFDVVYTVVLPNGKRLTSDFPSFSLSPDDYTIEYSYAEKNLLETRTFSVADEVAPIISFDNVPRDLFVGEQTFGSLPGVSIEEASELKDITRNLYFTGSDGNRKAVEYNVMNETYPITEGGEFEFVVKAEDTSGNKAEEKISWVVKDSQWQDPDLGENYLADFDEKGYINYIRSGDLSPWWNINGRYNDEWLESFEGATGVGKIRLGFTASGHTCINVKLAKPLTFTALSGKCLAVRAYVTGDGLYDSFGFAGIQKQNFGGEISAATINKDMKRGEWQTYYLTEQELKDIRMYSVDGKRDSDITNVQFCFSKDGSGGFMTLYIDSITLAAELAKPTGLAVEGKTVKWSEVEGATGYEVETIGKKEIVKETSYNLTNEKGLVSVRAIGDGKFALNSVSEKVVYGLKAKDGYLSSFDEDLYAYLVNNDVNLGGETSGYKVKSLTSEFKNGKLEVNFGKGGWGICSAINVMIPEVAELKAGDKLVVKMKIETENDIIDFRVGNAADDTFFGWENIREGFYEYSFDVSGDTTLGGIKLAFITKQSDIIDNVKITFEYIKVAREN